MNKQPLLVLNSTVNPLAYAFFKKDIKMELKKLICKRVLKKDNQVKPLNIDTRFTLGT